MPHFDLVTIGAGSGGIAASRYAASSGARVALCEAGRVGGTCVIRGCIPKKLLMYAGQFAEAFQDARAFGWSASHVSFDMGQMQATKQREVDRLEGIYGRMLESSGVNLFRGHGRVIDAHTVEVSGQTLTADRILIATGAATHRPDIAGIEHALTSDDVLDLAVLPKTLAILGSGYIAVEFGSILRSLGVAVTLAYRAPLPLRGFDDDIRTRLAAALADRGVVLEAGFQPVRIEKHSDGLTCFASDGRTIRADAVVNAMGRRPSSGGMGLGRLGIVGAKGEIRVDAASRTAIKSVFAIGDVTNRVALTPVAIAEGRAFVQSEFLNTPRIVDHTQVASAVFSLPPIACVGSTEAHLKEAGAGFRVFESDFRPMKNSVSGRSDRTYMKLVVAEPSGRVLGAHMIGVDAPEIVQSLAVAIGMGATKAQLDATMAVHPTAAEEFVLMRSARVR